MTPAQRRVLLKMSDGRLLFTHPGGFHLPPAPAHLSDGTTVNSRIVNALIDGGFIDRGEKDGTASGSAYTHEITDAGRHAIGSVSGGEK